MTTERRSFKNWWEDSHFVVRSLIVGGATLVPGILILWWASNNSKDIVAATFWSEVATTLIALGVLGVLYEGFLKSALLHDMQQSLSINSALLGVGLIDAIQEPDLSRMKDLFSSSTTITVFPADPLTWHVQNYGWLTMLAREHALIVRIYLPEPKAYSATRRSVDGGNPHATAEFCTDKFQEYRKSWDAAGFGAAGSRLERFTYNGYPHGGFVIGNDAAAIFVEDPVGMNRQLNGLTYLYRGAQAKETVDWLRKAIDRLNAAPIDGTEPDDRKPEDILPLIGSGSPTGALEERSGGADA